MSEDARSKYHVVSVGPRIEGEAEALLTETCSLEYMETYPEPSKTEEKVRNEKPDALLAGTGKITAEVIEASPRLKVISKLGTGVDVIDIAAATKLRIPVMITPNGNYQSVAEHVLGLMLILAKDIHTLDARVRQGHWDKAGYRGTELFKKTLGIVGFGRIGRRLMELVAPLKMEILVYDPFIEPDRVPPDVTLVDSLEAFLPYIDILSVHCPLTEQTRCLIGERELVMMKNKAWLINTARGGVVDEKALIQSLKKGDIAAAGLDTFEKEPLEEIEELVNAGKTVFTPHIAAHTEEAFIRMSVDAVRNILTVLEGKEVDPESVMNPEVLG